MIRAIREKCILLPPHFFSTCLGLPPVRRLVASLTLALFLFNILGYGGLLVKLRSVAEEKLTQRLDTNEHDMGGSLTVKVPFKLPEFAYIEPDYMVNTEIEQDGDIYRVIKQRHYSDTLYMVCIKDDLSTKIDTAIDEFAQSFAGDNADANKLVKTSPIKDYLNTLIGLSPTETGWEKTIVHPDVAMSLADVPATPITHPPLA